MIAFTVMGKNCPAPTQQRWIKGTGKEAGCTQQGQRKGSSASDVIIFVASSAPWG